MQPLINNDDNLQTMSDVKCVFRFFFFLILYFQASVGPLSKVVPCFVFIFEQKNVAFNK